ncbi:MAG: TetR/AcrR family transcriptional regulator [Eggerthellaceae bacterium]
MIRRNEYVSVHDTRAQVTREKLLKAAIKLVNRDGMKQLTVRNICDEAGLSTGSFYNLFSGKEDLISYYLKYAFTPYREKALEESEKYNPVERCLVIYRAYVRYCKDMGIEFVSGLYSSNHNPFFDFMHRDTQDDFIIATVRVYIEEAKELGLIRENVETDEVLLRIAAASTGLLFYWCVFDGKIDVDYEVNDAIEGYLRSIAVDPETVIGLEPLESKGAFLS